ncbi:phosphoribosyltransferase [Agromyces cerinus]|uniref:Predicted phosphoribosyltransferase n=1 Tax=Agromyces cerinus subsp. cerinus TaxID=232089 RepID=A0A1N6HNX1_9MICO|nr:phosphoribosyltransferase family protein [Agromyces cerinus]SIO21471.1 Predicted phosphoribosyltransferase [Agromyces cerinus subsp. cerinus]
MEHFTNRADAGRRLAAALEGVDLGEPVVLGLPRGGVPVAAPVAMALGAPLDVLVVRKLGVPGQPEVAMGAIGEQGARVLNDDIVDSAFVSPGELRDIERVERAELEARVARFRGGAPPVPLEGRTAVIVDDGVATGATARVAAVVAKARGAARVVLAIPVGASDSLGSLAADPAVDEIVCLSVPRGFMAVGMHYLDFAQTTDAQVAELLAAARAGG